MIYQTSASTPPTPGAASSTSAAANRRTPKCKSKVKNLRTRKRERENKTGGKEEKKKTGKYELFFEFSNVQNGIVSVKPGKREQVIRKEPIEKLYILDEEPFAIGLFATVRKCRHRVTGEMFAAKFAAKIRYGSDCTDELLHEVALLSYCASSPRIIRFQDVFETDTDVIIVMEYASGGDLQTIIDDDMVPFERDAVKYIKQLLEGLVYIHEKKVAHLDIKPQNLVLMGAFPDCDVKLCDFEISRLILDGKEVREILGTPDYVAPEVLQFEPITLATDMWSVGVLAYVLLTGFSPFAGDTDQETFVNICQSSLDFPEEIFDDVSADAIDFMKRLIVREPSARMTSSACMQHPWIASVASSSAPTTTSSGSSTCPPLIRHSSAPLPAAALPSSSVRQVAANDSSLRLRHLSKSREALYERITASGSKHDMRKNLSKSRERLWETKMNLSKSRDRLHEFRRLNLSKSRERLYGIRSLSRSQEVLSASRLMTGGGGSGMNGLWRMARLTSSCTPSGSVECIIPAISTDSIASTCSVYGYVPDTLIRPEEVERREVETGKATTVSIVDAWEALVEVPEDEDHSNQTSLTGTAIAAATEKEAKETVDNQQQYARLLQKQLPFIWNKSQSEPMLLNRVGDSTSDTRDAPKKKATTTTSTPTTTTIEKIEPPTVEITPAADDKEGEAASGDAAEPRHSVADLIRNFNKQWEMSDKTTNRRHSVAVVLPQESSPPPQIQQQPQQPLQPPTETSTRKLERHLSPSPVRKYLRTEETPTKSIFDHLDDGKMTSSSIVSLIEKNRKNSSFAIDSTSNVSDKSSPTLVPDITVAPPPPSLPPSSDTPKTDLFLRSTSTGSDSCSSSDTLSDQNSTCWDLMPPSDSRPTFARGRSGSVQVDASFVAQPWGRVCVGSVARAMEKFNSKGPSSGGDGLLAPPQGGRPRRQSSPIINPLA